MFEKIIENRLLAKLSHIEYGKLNLNLPSGEAKQFVGEKDGVSADITLHDWRVVAQLINKGDIGFTEDYRDGYWDTPNIEHVLLFALQNEKIFSEFGHGNYTFRLLSKLLYLTKRNSLKGSKKNIQAHYDLGNDFYKLWLDESMTYSSAIYQDVNQSLYEAQYNKNMRLINMIKKPSANILEIGCGWGGFAEMAAKNGHSIKGITLSQEQYSYAKNRTQSLNVEIALEDYRHQEGVYDIIVSIEMLEAVGEKYWNTYFNKLNQLINQDGQILIQTITIDNQFFNQYRNSADMIRTFIFPGGMLPSEQILEDVLAQNNLEITNIYRFGRDYAKTLREWLVRFDNKYQEIKSLGFDNEFIRLWRFYLSFCSAGFEHGRINVIQLEITKKGA